MFTLKKTLLCSTLIFPLQAFAADAMSPPEAPDNGPCVQVVQACQSAGFTRDAAGKDFWKDCMRPTLLGESVPGVTVDPATIQACRLQKIQALQKDLQDLQDVPPLNSN